MKKKRINRKRALYIAGGIALVGLGLWWLSRRNAPAALSSSAPAATLPPPPAAGVSGLREEHIPVGGADIDGLTLDDDFG